VTVQAQRSRGPAPSRTHAAASRSSRVASRAPGKTAAKGTAELSAIIKRAPRPSASPRAAVPASTALAVPRTLAAPVLAPVAAQQEVSHADTPAPTAAVATTTEEPTSLTGMAARWLLNQGLEQAGIPPAAFWALLARIRHVVPDILRDPLGFARNLLAGVGEGVRGFFERLSDHLLRGLLDWLTRGLAGAGVELPKDASPRSLVTFFLRLMGITWERIRGLLASRLGERNVALVEKAWRTISVLIEQGPSGLYELVKDRLDPRQLVDQALTTARDTVVAAVMPQVTARILALFNPVGAIAQALMAVYKVLEWIFQHAARLFSLVETVVAGMADIAAGNVSGLARKVELVLARLIGPLIDLLMRYLSLGDLPERIGAALKAMQQRVEALLERAIDWVVEKARKLWGDAKEAAGRLWRWWQQKKKFTDRAGAEHTLFFEGQGPGARLMVRSDLTSFTELVAQTPGTSVERAARIAALAIGRTMDTIRARALPDGSLPKLEQAPFAALMDKLAVHLAVLMASDDSSSRPVYGQPTNDGGFGTSMTILRMKKDITGGSEPTVTNRYWDKLVQRKHKDGTYYARGHLLNETLGGPGSTWLNIAPLNQYGTNKAHLTEVEVDVKKAVKSSGKVVRYEVRAVYPRALTNNQRLLGQLAAKQPLDARDQLIKDVLEAERLIPSALECEAAFVDAEGRSTPLVKKLVRNEVEDRSLDDYKVEKKATRRLVSLNINECIRECKKGTDNPLFGALEELYQVSEARARLLVEHGPFKDWEEIVSKKIGITTRITDRWRDDGPGKTNVKLDEGQTRWEG